MRSPLPGLALLAGATGVVAREFAVVTALGANTRSASFDSRVKGEAEDARAGACACRTRARR
jgi:hypothetical protein